MPEYIPTPEEYKNRIKSILQEERITPQEAKEYFEQISERTHPEQKDYDKYPQHTKILLDLLNKYIAKHGWLAELREYYES